MSSRLEAILIVIVVVVGLLLISGGITACGVWAWQSAADKRECRRARGVVTTSGDEWHCVGAQPEARQ